MNDFWRIPFFIMWGAIEFLGFIGGGLPLVIAGYFWTGFLIWIASGFGTWRIIFLWMPALISEDFRDKFVS